ncbi:MAG: helix-turn-helix domain-containing protein [Clostridium sp.]
MSQNPIGLRIKNLRKSKKLTLQQLATKANISISFLSDIENGRSNPSLERTQDIAKALDSSVSEILGEPSNTSDSFERDVEIISKDYTNKLLQLDGLMFNGKPLEEDVLEDFVSSIEICLKIAKDKNERYAKKK